MLEVDGLVLEWRVDEPGAVRRGLVAEELTETSDAGMGVEQRLEVRGPGAAQTEDHEPRHQPTRGRPRPSLAEPALESFCDTWRLAFKEPEAKHADEKDQEQRHDQAEQYPRRFDRARS